MDASGEDVTQGCDRRATRLVDVHAHAWHAATDLVVIGYGLAGAATAIAAADHGLQPLIIEKMPHSGGGIAVATDADRAFTCLRAACGGRTPDDVLRAFAEELTWLGDWIAEPAAASELPLELESVQGDAGYDLPERDAFGWILVKPLEGFTRYMNEIHPSPNHTNARPMDTFDPDRLEFPRIPSYAIFDDAGRRLGPIGFPIRTADADDPYEWSDDNLAEVEAGWIHHASTLEDLADRVNEDDEHAHVDPDVLIDAVERWNAHVDAGEDPQFLRPASTMVPLRNPPFYAVPVWPLVSNTQGPVHNVHRQVLDPFGVPISRLYTAGELGSVFGHLYLLAGNIGECFTSGRQAARHAASQKAWDENRSLGDHDLPQLPEVAS